MTFSWPEVPIGSVAETVERHEVPIPGRTYRQIGVRLWGEGAYERESLDGGRTRYSKLNRAEAGDIIVNKIWARNGSVTVVPESLGGCSCSGEFPLFRPLRERLYPSWFHWITKTRWFWQRCDIQSRGTSGKNRIRPEKFLAIPIPLPSLPEQQRIVARIEELAAKIEEASALRQQASAGTEAVIKSAMLHIFTPSPQYPEVPFESVCSEIIDNLHSNPVYSDEGVPCVRSPDVGWGKLRLATALKTSEEEYIRRTVRGEPRTDDIVLVREGGGTGKAAIVEEGQRFSLGQRVMLLRPDRGRVLPKFFLHQLLSPAIYEEQTLTLLKGSASPHLNIAALRKFRFYLPSLSEQQGVVTYLDNLQAKIDPLTRLQGENAVELDALLPSILDKAFKGEL